MRTGQVRWPSDLRDIGSKGVIGGKDNVKVDVDYEMGRGRGRGRGRGSGSGRGTGTGTGTMAGTRTITRTGVTSGGRGRGGGGVVPLVFGHFLCEKRGKDLLLLDGDVGIDMTTTYSTRGPGLQLTEAGGGGHYGGGEREESGECDGEAKQHAESRGNAAGVS
jgi:hypothetical protein